MATVSDHKLIRTSYYSHTTPGLVWLGWSSTKSMLLVVHMHMQNWKPNKERERERA